MAAQTPRSKLYSAIERVYRPPQEPKFLLRTQLACVWKQLLFQPQFDAVLQALSRRVAPQHGRQFDADECTLFDGTDHRLRDRQRG
jgi:hypothetical protein